MIFLRSLPVIIDNGEGSGSTVLLADQRLFAQEASSTLITKLKLSATKKSSIRRDIPSKFLADRACQAFKPRATGISNTQKWQGTITQCKAGHGKCELRFVYIRSARLVIIAKTCRKSNFITEQALAKKSSPGHTRAVDHSCYRFDRTNGLSTCTMHGHDNWSACRSLIPAQHFGAVSKPRFSNRPIRVREAWESGEFCAGIKTKPDGWSCCSFVHCRFRAVFVSVRLRSSWI